MKHTIFILFTVLTVLSCKDSKEKSREDTSDMPDDTASILQNGCYAYKGNGSEIRFEITETGNEVSGKLTYAFLEKDRNSGTFKGQVRGNKLMGNYTFLSEGKESTRQIAFQIEDGQLIEGYGQLSADGTAFKDPNDLQYNAQMPLSLTDCDP